MYQKLQNINKNNDRNTTPFLTRLVVWQKSAVVPGLNPSTWRKDPCGALMRWDLYGDTTPGGFGWEVDHRIPIAGGGGNSIANLQALQWQNNRSKGRSSSQGYCVITYRS